MFEQMLSIDLPEKYQAGLISYRPKLDGLDSFDLRRMGISEKKIKKMIIWSHIEYMKFLVEDTEQFTEEELEYANKRIKEEIEHYNSINLTD